MTAKLFTAALLLICTQKIFSQQPSYFSISDPLHANSEITMEKVIATSDSGSLVIGNARWNSWINSDGIVIKQDSAGQVQWIVRYGNNQFLNIYSAYQVDSNYYLGGSISS